MGVCPINQGDDMKVYHYTKEQHLPRILESGVLKLEEPYIGAGVRTLRPEQCLLWMTADIYVPNTARPVSTSYSGPLPYLDINWVRFVFDSDDPRIFKWTAYSKNIRGSKWKAHMKNMAARQGDDIRLWWVSPEPLEIGDYEKATVSPGAPTSRPRA